MARRILLAVAVLVAAGTFGWLVMTALGRLLSAPAAPPPEPAAAVVPAVAPTQPAEVAAGPRIKATLYFTADDGQRLMGVEQDVPLAEGTVGQARALITALLAATPSAPLASAVPEGTTLRGVYVSDQMEVFIDLDAAVRTNHRGGSMQELLTVYSLVNTIAVNLPTVAAVQILIDGRESDTLAGHVDLRRPLRKNEALIVTPDPTQSPS
jgi:spore germination protein GerM